MCCRLAASAFLFVRKMLRRLAECLTNFAAPPSKNWPKNRTLMNQLLTPLLRTLPSGNRLPVQQERNCSADIGSIDQNLCLLQPSKHFDSGMAIYVPGSH